jgi:hypothetical protein
MSTPPGDPVWTPADTVAHEVGRAEYDEDAERPAAVLWIPDIEQRHGWREYYVKKAQQKPNGKRMGYKR